MHPHLLVRMMLGYIAATSRWYISGSSSRDGMLRSAASASRICVLT